MTDRDHFAAAALTGLLFHNHEPPMPVRWWTEQAYAYADAMLRERGNRQGNLDSSNHDASPDARGQNPTECSCLHREGCSTGNTDDAATGEPGGGVGFSPGSRTGPIIQPPERESPRRECGESALRDVPQLDNSRAAGGPEHHISDRPKPVKDDDSDRSKPINRMMERDADLLLKIGRLEERLGGER